MADRACRAPQPQGLKTLRSLAGRPVASVAGLPCCVHERDTPSFLGLINVNGQDGLAPLVIDTTVGAPVTLDASASTDPDGHTLRFSWFFYPEAGTGIASQPVAAGPPVPIGGGGSHDEGGIPAAGADGPPQPPARLTLDRTTGPRVTATLRTPGTAHVILVGDDNGTPALTSYRRVIVKSTGP